MNPDSILQQTQRQRVSDGTMQPILNGCESASYVLVLIWSQLGDFDSLEYAWWLQRGATFLFDSNGERLYEHRDRGILGFSKNMSYPLSFLHEVLPAKSRAN